jgi:exosome complex component RRP4
MAGIVVPGQVITSEGGFLRGHGTYIEEPEEGGEPQLIACVAGVVERVNKLISVR